MPATPPPLPPGQRERDDFPRFGLPPFAERFPKHPDRVRLEIGGDVETPTTVTGDALRTLPRAEQTSDFHCVTTWTTRGLHWSGVRFAEFFAQIVGPRAQPQPDATFVVFRCQDGYAVSLPLDDLLADDVLLADRLDGEPLSIAHGAPLRLVAPAHYGYKNPKHLKAVEFHRDDALYRPAAYRFMDHPRARVALEERGRGMPGWVLRTLYRRSIDSTAEKFAQALDAHRRETSG